MSGSVGVVKTQFFTLKEEFFFESGRVLSSVTVAYETYGKLNEARDNAILVCHALTGNAHAAGFNREDDQRPGWWDSMIGPGKAFDTDKYFVISSNFLGSCFGTTGPSSVDPQTKKRYGLKFPVVTVRDMVKLQKKLIDHLGIEVLHSVAGGSMGGMQALEWGATFPYATKSIIPIAASAAVTPMAIAFNAIAKFAIMKDPNWRGGDYYDDVAPLDGLAIARMAGHITYMSDASFHSKFGRRYATFEGIYDFKGLFEVENYLRYNGYKFTEFYDPNTYLYVLKAMDIFELAYGRNGLKDALRLITSKALFITFTSDFLFPPYQTEELVTLMKEIGNEPRWENIESDYGHDAFLLEFEAQTEIIKNFLSEV
ncbi:homoserine O-acetyltransferase [Denitrovibrio acetiphilus DSM 12809]|uniref:Homoserine O-acetyltransferase n=1 Tax=Denitrovibrio acetiphilus (strain DSM 12809 / NBRC 114555 / N2460) TaxID=522772 RepID=D4H5Q1_DENA2|nr:homoserine O-acetyltransferase [Denitrovibrio acetiphilus]ADD69492.1 homoserine O-acetyltransferase [Denitrovibrio acetiphilus DSM 12809]